MFNRVVEARGIAAARLPHGSHNLNAHMERFTQSAWVECLDRFIVMGARHLDRLVGEYIEHYNGERPHSELGHRIPGGPAPPGVGSRTGSVVCRTRLGVCRGRIEARGNARGTAGVRPPVCAGGVARCAAVPSVAIVAPASSFVWMLAPRTASLRRSSRGASRTRTI